MIDFLCIGAQKAGTTWLMANLDEHPDIWTPRFVKELHYFDAVHLGFNMAWLLKKYAKKGTRIYKKGIGKKTYFQKVIDPEFAFTDQWYHHLFSIAPKGAKVGECTPLYCAIGESGVRHVHSLAPAVRLIYIIRDPLERLKSSLRMAIERKAAKNAEEVVHLLEDPLFLSRGDYRQNITCWESVFPAEQILYIPYGDIRDRPETVIRKAESHIGVGRCDAYPSLTEAVHVTKKKKIEFEGTILERLISRTSPQTAFLGDRFGEEFVSRCR